MRIAAYYNHPDPLHKRQREDSRYPSQRQMIPKHLRKNFDALRKKNILQYFKKNIATVSMCSHATGISKGFIGVCTREMWRKNIWPVAKALCCHTKFKAWYFTSVKSKRYTTNLPRAAHYHPKKQR